MNAFDILAEAKIRQWQQDLRDGKGRSTSAGSSPSFNNKESLEKILYDEIRRTIIKSYQEPEEDRKNMLSKAAEMQVQLAARLEKSGHNLMSKMFAEEIQKIRLKADAARHDKELLSSMLAELD